MNSQPLSLLTIYLKFVNILMISEMTKIGRRDGREPLKIEGIGKELSSYGY